MQTLKLTASYFIKYVITAYNFRSNMIKIAGSNILIKIISLTIFLRLPQVGSGIWKKIGVLILRKNCDYFLRIDNSMYYIPFEK